MSIRVQCPGCRTQISLGDEFAGKKVRCQSCDAVLNVPASQRWTEGESSRKSGLDLGAKEPGVRPGQPPPRKPIASAPEVARKRREPDHEPRAGKRNRGDGEASGASTPRTGTGKPTALILMIAGGSIAAVMLVLVMYFTLGGRGGHKDEPIAATVPLAEAPPLVKPAPDEKKLPVVEPTSKEDPSKVATALPGAIEPTMVQKVKKSTVFLHVTMPGGDMAEGSGFFAFEPGVVLTNAHVLGMLNADARRPKEVKVTVNSGEPDERVFKGQVLDVDRHSDLAVLRVPGDPASMPPPLLVATARELIELQKVYIFGFPFGSKLGKNITVSESSVSSIRKDEEGIIEKVQVNGGMHPGNSGGPVVDARGHVVGVSVAGIRGTSINFAVPGDFVHVILDGRLAQFGIEAPYLEGGALSSSVRMICIDPLSRVKAAHVEVWVGPAGALRKTTTEKPAPAPGDSPRQTFPLTLKDGQAVAAVTLPALEGGKAYYFQPVLVNGSGVTKWAACLPYIPPPLPPFERKAIDLRQKYGTAQRTLFLKSSSKIKIPDTDSTRSFTYALETDLSEVVRFADATATSNISYLRTRLGVDLDGRPALKSTRLQRALAGLSYITQDILMDSSGNLTRSPAQSAKVPVPLKEDAIELHDQVLESLEALSIPTPNRLVNPRETWTATRPLLIPSDGKSQIADMVIVYTYDGCRKRDGKDEARISFSGIVKGRAGRESAYGGKVEGVALFDPEAGFISEARADVTFDLDLKALDGTVPAVGNLHAEIKRAAGLLVAKEAPPPLTGPGPGLPGLVMPFAKSKIIFQTNGALTPGDFSDNIGSGRAKVFSVKLKKGKDYQIDLVGKGFDPMVRVETPTAMVLGMDDDGAGALNSRLIIRSPADGIYRIVVTSFGANQFGFFQLVVKEGL